MTSFSWDLHTPGMSYWIVVMGVAMVWEGAKKGQKFYWKFLFIEKAWGAFNLELLILKGVMKSISMGKVCNMLIDDINAFKHLNMWKCFYFPFFFFL